MHQMPLDQYSAKCDQFLKLVELYMRKNFNIAVSKNTVVVKRFLVFESALILFPQKFLTFVQFLLNFRILNKL
jgi:hypothetical protein